MLISMRRWYMDRQRAVYSLRLLMGCPVYFDFSPVERLAILKRVMAQVVAFSCSDAGHA